MNRLDKINNAFKLGGQKMAYETARILKIGLYFWSNGEYCEVFKLKKNGDFGKKLGHFRCDK